MKRNRLICAVAGLAAVALSAAAADAPKPVSSSPPPGQPKAVPAAKPAPLPARAAAVSKPVGIKVAMVKPAPAPTKQAAAKPAPAPVSNPPKPAAAKPTPPKPAAAAVVPPKPAAPPAPSSPLPPATGPVIPKGLVLHFAFDQAEPKGAVADASGQNNAGLATGARWLQTGKRGGGFEFSPPANHIKVPNSASLNLKHATFATWFRCSRTDGIWRRMFEKGIGRGYAMGIAGDTQGVPTRGKVAVSLSGAPLCLSDYVVTDGSWHHAAASYDGENLKLYIDGVLQKQVVPFRGQIPETAEELTIGANRPTPTVVDPIQCFEGALDEVMIFHRALSEEEIKTMVLTFDPNAGKPLFSKGQVAGRLRQLKLLFEEGLLTDEFYEAKVSECEAAGQ